MLNDSPVDCQTSSVTEPQRVANAQKQGVIDGRLVLTTSTTMFQEKARVACYPLIESKILIISGCSAVGSARALGARCRRFESCHSDHKETIILIRKISVLWLFYCKNWGNLPFS